MATGIIKEKGRISLKDYMETESGLEEIERMRICNVQDSQIRGIVMHTIGMNSVTPIYLMRGLIVKTNSSLCIFKSIESINSASDLKENKWELVTEEVFTSGVEHNAAVIQPNFEDNHQPNPIKVKTSFYADNYFIVDISTVKYTFQPFIHK
jgi:hypothetical protein